MGWFVQLPQIPTAYIPAFYLVWMEQNRTGKFTEKTKVNLTPCAKLLKGKFTEKTKQVIKKWCLDRLKVKVVKLKCQGALQAEVIRQNIEIGLKGPVLVNEVIRNEKTL